MAESAERKNVNKGARMKERHPDNSPGILRYLFDTPGRLNWEDEGDYGGFDSKDIGIENSKLRMLENIVSDLYRRVLVLEQQHKD